VEAYGEPVASGEKAARWCLDTIWGVRFFLEAGGRRGRGGIPFSFEQAGESADALIGFVEQILPFPTGGQNLFGDIEGGEDGDVEGGASADGGLCFAHLAVQKGGGALNIGGVLIVTTEVVGLVVDLDGDDVFLRHG